MKLIRSKFTLVIKFDYKILDFILSHVKLSNVIKVDSTDIRDFECSFELTWQFIAGSDIRVLCVLLFSSSNSFKQVF